MIVAVVVTHSVGRDLLDACVDALVSAGGLDVVTVVDNGGRRTGTEPVVADHDHRSADAATTEVERIDVANRGYGAAADVGLQRALDRGATAVAVLNDDVVVSPGWLEPLVDALGDTGVGAVQPVLLDATNPHLVASAGVSIGPDGAGVDVAMGTPYDPREEVADLDLFTGGAVLFDAEYVRATGGFDERWFLYYEDVDLARRGRELGWRHRLVPASAVVHHGGVSTSRRPDRTRYLQERNRLWAAVRFGSPATIGRAFWLSIRRLRHHPRGVHVRALVAGFAGVPRWAFRRAAGRTRTGPVA